MSTANAVISTQITNTEKCGNLIEDIADLIGLTVAEIKSLKASAN
jgi:hypothetical protein